MRAQLRCTGDVGILLSGGLDSSSVGATAAAMLADSGRPLRAYHAAPREGFSGQAQRGMLVDETADVAALAARYPNIDVHLHRPDGHSPFDDIERSFRLTGAPVRNASNVGWYDALCARAGADGVRVLLQARQAMLHRGARAARRRAARQGGACLARGPRPGPDDGERAARSLSR
ncbi:MAG: hypothetical protein IPF47_10120 [Gemmatimonadetes bacterium]|nr:hypothetical protein [Gemmatimonadota bacterium]